MSVATSQRITTFHAGMPGRARQHLWLPYQTTLLAFLPGGGHTVFIWKYCPQTHEFAHNVGAVGAQIQQD